MDLELQEWYHILHTWTLGLNIWDGFMILLLKKNDLYTYYMIFKNLLFIFQNFLSFIIYFNNYIEIFLIFTIFIYTSEKYYIYCKKSNIDVNFFINYYI